MVAQVFLAAGLLKQSDVNKKMHQRQKDAPMILALCLIE